MDIQYSGWFHQFQSQSLDPIFIDIVHRFEPRWFQQVPLCVDVDPVRLVEHDAELRIPLRNDVDGSIREVPITDQDPLLFPIQVDSPQHQVVFSGGEEIPVFAQKLFLVRRARGLEIVPKMLLELRKVFGYVQDSREQGFFDVRSGVFQNIPACL